MPPSRSVAVIPIRRRRPEPSPPNRSANTAASQLAFECSTTAAEPNYEVFFARKFSVHSMRIMQGFGWSIEGLGAEFRLRKALALSMLKVKFRSQSDVHLPDIGV
jgi:hypothetical protein